MEAAAVCEECRKKRDRPPDSVLALRSGQRKFERFPNGVEKLQAEILHDVCSEKTPPQPFGALND